MGITTLLFLLFSTQAKSLPTLFGFVFAAEGWGSPSANFSSSQALSSLNALRATGARTLRVVLTRYVDSENSTLIHGLSNTPLATTEAADVEPFLLAAIALNLSVTLSLTVDINWALPENFSRRAWYKPGSLNREKLGLGWSDANWDAFFDSWAAVLAPLASLAQSLSQGSATCSLGAPGVSLLTLGDTLDTAFSQEARMRRLISGVRAVYKGCISAVSNGRLLPTIGWWDAVDVIGHEAYWPLAATASPIGSAPSVASLLDGWQGVAETMAAVSAANGGKRIAFLTAGAQSRPNCHLEPWGTGGTAPGPAGNNQGDVSAWPLSYDMHCQANVYEALFQAFEPFEHSWYAGFTLWRWSPDPTQGGPSDNDYSPHGKEAEGVFRQWVGSVSSGEGRGAIEEALEIAHPLALAAVAASVKAPPTTTSAAGFSGWRGWVLGGPDEWSSPNYRLDSPGAQSSLGRIASLGGNAVELVVQWYFSSANETTMYPIVDSTSPMPTSTDAEITAFITRAKDAGVGLVLSPMLDPDWTLPANFNCRTGWPEPAGCHWRGEIGFAWGDDCSPGTPWDLWHSSYAAFMLHYARLAEEAMGGVEALIVAHELELPASKCGDHWSSLLAAIRAVFSGKLLVALGGDVLTAPPQEVAWLRQLDLLGFECYMGNTTASLPALPWEDAPLADVIAGQQENVKKLGEWSARMGGMKIACTEVGWISAPWAAESGWGHLQDASDGSVFALDVSVTSQARAYDAFLSVFEAQPWYAGAFFWLWRADPTAGGGSDASPVVWGKSETMAVIMRHWL